MGQSKKNISVFYSKVVRCLLFMQQLNIKTKDFKLSKIAIFLQIAPENYSSIFNETTDQ